MSESEDNSTSTLPPFIKRAGVDSIGRNMRKRRVRKTGEDIKVIDAVVSKNLGKVSDKEVKALARRLNHNVDTMKEWVRDAKQKFLANASRYVEVHRQAVESALAAGDTDPKYLEVATRGAQWAIERLSAEGERVVEQNKQDEQQGVKVLIGVKVGGMVQDNGQ